MASRPVSPAEPTKKHLPSIQPNAHPYAIKTTSSALLSRSNSSSHSSHHTRHHYVPPSPSRIPTGMSVRHRHSSSLSSVEAEVRSGARTVPLPLPTPPPIGIGITLPDNPSVSLNRADDPKLTHRVRRAETMPPGSSATVNITGNYSYDQKYKFSHDHGSGLEPYPGLPPNPKQWNTDELVAYLKMSLWSRNHTDGDEDGSSFMGVLECVRTRGLTGRELLRLTEVDLAGTPLSDTQRAQLLECSRTLRADVLRKRIYVDSYRSHKVFDSSNDICSRSTHSSTPFHSLRSASISVDNLQLFLDNDTSEGAFPPAMSLRRSNTVSDASVQRYRDLARMRMRRRGKVKGLVETWERASTSGSECSAHEEGTASESEAESEHEADPEFKSISDIKHSPDSFGPSPVLRDEPFHDIRSPTARSSDAQEPHSLTPPPPYTHTHTALEVMRDEEEEPSIEELLASSSSIPLRGARAWEADFGLGETVKRIPVSTSVDANCPSPSVTEPDASLPKNDGQKPREDPESKRSGMWSTGDRGKNTKIQKRVVTAIFTGSPPNDASENIGDKINLMDHHRHASGVNGVVRDKAPLRSDLPNDPDSALQALEESIAATRAQMEALRLRLEEVEADTTRREAELDRAQCSDSYCFSEFQSRRRQLGVNKQATLDTAELPKNEMPVSGFRNRDLEMMSTRDIVRMIVARAIVWVFPYGHLGSSECKDQDRFQARDGSRPGADNRYPFLAKRSGRFSVARTSCSIILVSFAICAAVLRKMGLGRWVRRP